MRVAIVSDIHGNLTAFEAVLADIRRMSPDLVVHGGDLADGGSSPVEIVDRVRALGWQGVMGNTDEMLVRPEALQAFAAESSAPVAMWQAVREVADGVRSALGPERLAWLSELPMLLQQEEFALLHASPASCWRAPAVDASDETLREIYGGLGHPVVLHGHTHIASVREMEGGLQLLNPRLSHLRVLVDTGSVGLPYDGDPRSGYVLLEDGRATIRRVAYDLEREVKLLVESGLPHAAWTARMLRAAAPQMPE